MRRVLRQTGERPAIPLHFVRAFTEWLPRAVLQRYRQPDCTDVSDEQWIWARIQEQLNEAELTAVKDKHVALPVRPDVLTYHDGDEYVFDAVCCAYTCRRLIYLSPIAGTARRFGS